MSQKIKVRYSSFCPHTEQEQEISITYAEIPLLRQSRPEYKVISFSCPYPQECPYHLQSRSGYCPVVDSAPEPPY